MTLEEAIKWIADIFEEPVERITPETTQAMIAAWDSLGILTLMARLNEDFDILLAESELQEMKSVNDVLETMKRHGKLNY
jgi:acyl carrier protein